MLALFLSTGKMFLHTDELQKLLTEKTTFTEYEKTEVILQYNLVVKEGLQKNIISDVIAEGAAKKVSFKNLISELKRKREQLRVLKEFCRNTAKTELVIRDDEKSVKKLIFTLDNGFSSEDVFNYHEQLKKYKIDSYQYLDLVRRSALYYTKGVQKDYTIEVLKTAFDTGKNYGYAKKVLRLFDGADKKSTEQIKNFIIQGIKEKRNIYELEEDIKNRFKYRQKEKTLRGENRRDEINENRRKNRMGDVDVVGERGRGRR